MPKTLYICYFGLREPLVQTQVLPYLREIGKGGVDVSILTFEPEFAKSWTREAIEETRERLAAEGITWHCLAYHKAPSVPATAYDVLRGTLRVRRLVARERYDVLHARVHLPMLMAAIARKFSRVQPKLLFDIRGFFPEEYTDAGRWPEGGWLFRAAKRVERWLLRESDAFVVLTEKARDILFAESRETGRDHLGRPVEVIPCCVDFSRFDAAASEGREQMRAKLGVEGRRVVAYAGSFGGWYMTDEMLEMFATAKEQDASSFALILTQRDKEKVAEAMRARGFADGEFLVTSVPPDEIARYLNAADISISFIKACYSKLSSSPTKLAEYLACGLPIIANRGVGDVDALIEDNGVGVLLDDFSEASYVKALEGLASLGNISARCRETARRHFDLETVGGARYSRIYSRLCN
ncbi:MAG: glycosyltransferase family 4 protein [Acidobacteria bacterium]|nr:glycosyltransferase family 4 protein [Acidobacteriota bacterium]